MRRPSLELADVIRDAGPAFIAQSRGWFTRLHLKVLVAILAAARRCSADMWILLAMRSSGHQL